MENDAFDLGTEFGLNIAELAGNVAGYTIEQLISALNATTTLTKLTVSSDPFLGLTPPLNIRRVMEPLGRCIANLRNQNEHHPLKAVEFTMVEIDVVRQFLVAMKQFGVFRVQIQDLNPLPIHILLDFCRDNRYLKVLDLRLFTLVSLPPSAQPQNPNGDSATTLNLDKLILSHVRCKTTTTATSFARLLSHMSVLALELGALLDEYDLFKMPSVEVLTVYAGSETKHFQAALEAGMSTVTRLTVDFMPLDDENETTKKLKSLTHMIRGAVKLRSLTIHNHSSRNQLCPPRQLFQALEACASITEIHVNHDDGYPHDFTEPEVQQLRQITARNSELGQFVGNPSTFPNDKLLILMLQLDECPSGLYMLARRLPEVFSFEKGNCLFPSMEPNLTRKLRKRRKISYKA